MPIAHAFQQISSLQHLLSGLKGFLAWFNQYQTQPVPIEINQTRWEQNLTLGRGYQFFSKAKPK